VTERELRQHLATIRERLEHELVTVDPHRRLAGRPVTFRIIAGQAVEIVYRDVPSIDEAEVLGVKRLVGQSCFCSVLPQTAETVTVRFVVPLEGLTETG
jgi:hypothetical protein